jgi:hypothetical protein
MKFKKFIAECRDNEVLKNLSIYIVSSWVLLQVVATVAEPMGLPEVSLSYLLIILLIGFPLYIYLLWRYSLIDKIKKTPLLDGQGNPVPGKFIKSPFQKMYFSFLSVIGILALSIVIVVLNKKFAYQTALPIIKVSDKIAVLKFDNNTGDDSFDMAGKMATDWIIHGITENKLGQVISPEIIEDYSAVLKASLIPGFGDNKNLAVSNYLQPSKIISGEYYLNKNRLLFQGSITDESINQTLYSFKPVACDPDAPLDCIESLKQRILGYLISEDKELLSLEEKPPNYNAYQYLLQAKTFQDKNDAEHLRLLDKSIAADSTFFEPKTYQLLYYYNSLQYKIADSLLKKLSLSTVNNRQRNLLNVYEGLLKGNNRNVDTHLKQEYNFTPFHIETNASMMTVALQFVNQPEAIDSIYAEINMDAFDLKNCVWCENRYYIRSLADIELQKYDQAIALLSPFAKESDYYTLKKILLKAHIKAGNDAEVNRLLADFLLISGEDDWIRLSLFSAKQFLILKKKKTAQLLLDKAIEVLKNAKDLAALKKRKFLAEALFFKENYQEAALILEALLQLDPESINHTALLAISYDKNGKQSEARSKINTLEMLRTHYQFGAIDYALAQYYAAISNEEQALKNLLKSVAAGNWYAPETFQDDPLFLAYYGTEGFERVMNFWH